MTRRPSAAPQVGQDESPRWGESGFLPCRARDNPFRVERVHSIRYQPLDSTWEELFGRFQASGFRGAIVGPPGSGKTTLLEDVALQLELIGKPSRWLQIRDETRKMGGRWTADLLRQASTSDVLLVDGVEQLGPLAWRRLRVRSRSHAGLIVTSHTPGRLPTLVECRTTVGLLEQIVSQLAPPAFDRLRPQLPRLFARHDGNVRLSLRELYDQFASGSACELQRPAWPSR